MDPFKTMQLKHSYYIEEGMLDRQYQDMMRQMHPDLYHTKPEQDFAIMQSVEINQAFDILKDPIKRAASLLAIKSIDPDSLTMSFDKLAMCLELQENQAFDEAKSIFEAAQNAFGEAWGSGDLAALKENFLLMKYLARFLQSS